MNEVLKGIVKFYDQKKGYGFLIENDTKKEYFFHVTGLNDKENLPQAKDLVVFTLTTNDKGLKATEIEIIN
jgi:CspA family cold shock protein